MLPLCLGQVEIVWLQSLVAMDWRDVLRARDNSKVSCRPFVEMHGLILHKVLEDPCGLERIGFFGPVRMIDLLLTFIDQSSPHVDQMLPCQRSVPVYDQAWLVRDTSKLEHLNHMAGCTCA